MTSCRQSRVAWILLACACAAAVFFFLSTRFEFGCSLSRDRSVLCTRGLIAISWRRETPFTPYFERWHAMELGPFYATRTSGPAYWWFLWRSDLGILGAGMPLWLPFSLFSISGIISLWRAHSRPRPGLCSHCHYPLTGLPPNSPCPECGRAQPAGGRA